MRDKLLGTVTGILLTLLAGMFGKGIVVWRDVSMIGANLARLETSVGRLEKNVRRLEDALLVLDSRQRRNAEREYGREYLPLLKPQANEGQ